MSNTQESASLEDWEDLTWNYAVCFALPFDEFTESFKPDSVCPQLDDMLSQINFRINAHDDRYKVQAVSPKKVSCRFLIRPAYLERLAGRVGYSKEGYAAMLIDLEVNFKVHPAHRSRGVLGAITSFTVPPYPKEHSSNLNGHLIPD